MRQRVALVCSVVAVQVLIGAMAACAATVLTDEQAAAVVGSQYLDKECATSQPDKCSSICPSRSCYYNTDIQMCLQLEAKNAYYPKCVTQTGMKCYGYGPDQGPPPSPPWETIVACVKKWTQQPLPFNQCWDPRVHL